MKIFEIKYEKYARDNVWKISDIIYEDMWDNIKYVR